MDTDALIVNVTQPTLFDWGDSSAGTLELFPSVWGAAEALTSPDVLIRQAGLDRLVELNAARFSPLVAYLIGTRLTDPDIALRAHIVQTLASIFSPDQQGRPAPEMVRQHLTTLLSQMRARQIYALLQVASFDSSLEPQIAILLNTCSYAGNHLGDILANREALVSIRQKAAHFIGQVGYCDAIPLLERLLNRLEARQNGQQMMPFLRVNENDEITLLPAVRGALNILNAP